MPPKPPAKSPAKSKSPERPPAKLPAKSVKAPSPPPPKGSGKGKFAVPPQDSATFAADPSLGLDPDQLMGSSTPPNSSLAFGRVSIRKPRAVELAQMQVQREEESDRRSIETNAAAEQSCVSHMLLEFFLSGAAPDAPATAVSSPTAAEDAPPGTPPPRLTSSSSWSVGSGAPHAGGRPRSLATASQVDALRADVAQFSLRAQASLEKLLVYAHANDQEMTLDKALARIGEQRIVMEQQEQTIRQLNLELRGMKDTLNRKLLRTRIENDALRSSVNEATRNAQLNLDAFKGLLFERVDSAVLAFHQPLYHTALRELHEMTETVSEKVRIQADDLKKIISDISATDPTEAQGLHCDRSKGPETMHSALPEYVRKDLGRLSKEQLLNLIDIVSFEDGVVDTVGRALSTSKLTSYQGVFQ